jgi:hypothetical protein
MVDDYREEVTQAAKVLGHHAAKVRAERCDVGALASRAGRACAAKYGRAYMQELGRRGAERRRQKAAEHREVEAAG